MYEVCVREKFDAAHFLPEHQGKCANLHGHTWLVEVVIKSPALDKGMVIDFIDVKAMLKDILPDHTLLNDKLPNPTAENLARHVYDELKKNIPGLVKVSVWESDYAGAAYFED